MSWFHKPYRTRTVAIIAVVALLGSCTAWFMRDLGRRPVMVGPTPAKPGGEGSAGLAPGRTDAAQRLSSDYGFAEAMRLRAEGKVDEAVTLLTAIADSPIPDTIRIQALRLLGQIDFAAGRTAEAERRFADVLSLVRSGAVGNGSEAIDAASALNQLYVVRLGRKDFEGAREANAAILSLNKEYLLPGSLGGAHFHDGVILGRLNRAEEGIASARAAEDIFEREGLVARKYDAVLLRAHLQESLRNWSAAATSLGEYWAAGMENRPEAAQRMVSVSLRLFEAKKWADGQVAAMDFAKEAVLKFESVPIENKPWATEDRRMAEVSLLSSMVNADVFGRPDLAEWSIDRLAAILPPNSSEWLTNEQLRLAFRARQEARGR